MVSLDPAMGHEQQGHRPVLIVSSSKLNAKARLPVIVPITSGGNFARALGLSVSLSGAGTRTTGIIRCDQPRAVDLLARGGRKVESLPSAVLEEVLNKLHTIFE